MDPMTLPYRFRRLHQSGCFVMPNPWDPGSARLLASLGFEALATTSAGFAWSRGQRDNQITLHQALDHLREVAGAVSIPVNADFEGGFAVDPGEILTNVGLAVETGISGLSIEDSTGDGANPLFEFGLAVDRIRAAREAIDRSGTGVWLTGRSEGFLVGRPDLAETIRRLVAYAEAGADCLYAPRLSTVDEVKAVVAAVAPCPVNVLVGGPWTTVAELAGAGVRRISVGGGLARVAFGSALIAARAILVDGTFGGLDSGMPFAAIEAAMDDR